MKPKRKYVAQLDSVIAQSRKSVELLSSNVPADDVSSSVAHLPGEAGRIFANRDWSFVDEKRKEDFCAVFFKFLKLVKIEKISAKCQSLLHVMHNQDCAAIIKKIFLGYQISNEEVARLVTDEGKDLLEFRVNLLITHEYIKEALSLAFVCAKAVYMKYLYSSKMTDCYLNLLRINMIDVQDNAAVQHDVDSNSYRKQLIKDHAPFLLELINSDINTISKLESQVFLPQEEIEKTESRISKYFLLLALLFKSNITIYSELLLTSFCVNPTEENHTKIIEVADLLYENTTLHNNNENSSVAINRNNNKNGIVTKSRLKLSDVKNFEIYGLSNEYLDDLITWNNSARWVYLNWDLNKNELKELCINYFKDPVKTRGRKVELNCLERDYSSFIPKPKEKRKIQEGKKTKDKKTRKREKSSNQVKKKRLNQKKQDLLKDLALKERASENCVRCKICLKRFVSIKTLHFHIVKYHNGIELQKSAKTSHTKSPKPSRVNKNKKTAALSQQCDICSKKFSNGKELEDHIKTYHRAGEKRLPVTPQQDHPKTMVNTRKRTAALHKYATRSKKFCEGKKLEDHFKKMVASQKAAATTVTDIELIKCGYCVKKFKTNSQLYKHVVTVHTEPKQCKYCLKMIKDMKYHIDYFHFQVDESPNIPCILCSLTFKRNSQLKYHYKKCHNQ